MKKTILVLAANPVDTEPLRLDREIREISEGLSRASHRESFILESVLAARPEDVRRAMLKFKPTIVHFCGHGAQDGGIAFEDDTGCSLIVTPEALSGFFKLFADQVECVVLNACYSDSQADAIGEHIEHVVGMHGGVDDEKAIMFSVAFYDALGAGKDVKFAYELALNATEWDQNGDTLTPILKSAATSPSVDEPNIVRENTEKLRRNLTSALSAFKGQPEVFVEPVVTKERDSTEADNILPDLVVNPKSALVLAQPEFGQTCLCHYLRLEAHKQGSFWVYVDARHTKTRKVMNFIKDQFEDFSVSKSHPDCILLDSWDGNIIDHANMLKCLDAEFPETPILVMMSYTEPTFSESFSFSKLQHQFELLHLQPLRRTRVRELVTKYSEAKNWPSSNDIVTNVVRDLEALNVHRTPLNCLTILRVFEKEQNENIVNRTRLIKTLLFILFTDSESFTYAGTKPDVDDCEYILGRFCKTLLDGATRVFQRQEVLKALKNYCEEKLISVDVKLVIDILESNNIILSNGDRLEFKHSHWMYYFAAAYMLHDSGFTEQILSDRRYVNYPEIIEFYTGCDGRRSDAVQVLLSDMEALVACVDSMIGIPGDFNPYDAIVWNPSDEVIEAMRVELSKEVREESNVPTTIKDQHADKHYDSQAPYDQTIQKFLHEFSVISLFQAIKASSRALRNSKYVDPDLKLELLSCIVRGWASMARIVFILAPTLAQRGHAAYDGFGVVLAEGFEGSYEEKIKNILLAGPMNVVRHLKDDLSSGKLGPLVGALITGESTDIQKHFLAHFLVRERPEGWFQVVWDYMNMLHSNSFYLWDISGIVNSELNLGYTTQEEQSQLKRLAEIVVAKHIEGPRKKRTHKDYLKPGQAISAANILPIDKIHAAARRSPSYTRRKSAISERTDSQQPPGGDS